MIIEANNYRDVDLKLWRWPNFHPREFASRDGAAVKIAPELLDGLQSLRNALGQPIYINSGYRTPAHNASVGGAPNSQHVHGRAADIALDGLDGRVVLSAALAAGFRGIGIYSDPRFVHLDVRPSAPVLWASRGGQTVTWLL